MRITLLFLLSLFATQAHAQTFDGLIGTDQLLGRDSAGSGQVEQLDVGGGLGFSGAGGIIVSDEELACLRDLTSEADKFPYFTGSGTCALADFSNISIPPTRQVFTTSGTWTAPAGCCKAVFVQVQAGGGGGGGIDGGETAGDRGGGGGGGGGGYAEKLIASPDSSVTVTVGGGGAGGAAGPNNGSTGGTSSFADTSGTVSATGGAGGTGGTSSDSVSNNAGGAGGTGSGGEVNRSGRAGGRSVYANGNFWQVSSGGDAPLGWGGQGETSSGNGAAGGNYGGGGAGGVDSSRAQTTDYAGGDGGDGIVIVWEYY